MPTKEYKIPLSYPSPPPYQYYVPQPRSSTLYRTTGEVVLVSAFPVVSFAFAAAAVVSKARCEVDAEAAAQAVSTLALDYNDMD